MSSFLRRNKDKNLIPPVQENSGGEYSTRRASDSRSSSTAYNPSRDGSGYRSNSGSNGGTSYPDRAAYKEDKGDLYSRGDRNIDNDRSELFAGYNPEVSGGVNRFRDGPERPVNGESIQGDNEEEDVEAIKQQARFTKQESVNSTRNALRIAREAEETGRNTLLRLGDQSEKIASTERHLDVAKGHSNRAEDKTDELKQLNRSIFRPVITFNKDAKRRAQETKLQDRWQQEKEDRELAMADIRDSQNRVGNASAYGLRSPQEGEDDTDGIMSNQNGRTARFRSAESQMARKEQRKRFQFEAAASDDEMEDELDDNLDEISEATSRLKSLGLAMGQEIESQIGRLERIDGKVGRLDNKIYSNTERLKRIK